MGINKSNSIKAFDDKLIKGTEPTLHLQAGFDTDDTVRVFLAHQSTRFT